MKKKAKKQPAFKAVTPPKPMQQEHTQRQIPEHLDRIAGGGGIEAALTLLDHMAAVLDVMCNINTQQDSPEPEHLARVFFVLHQWTDFARTEIHDWYQNETAA